MRFPAPRYPLATAHANRPRAAQPRCCSGVWCASAQPVALAASPPSPGELDARPSTQRAHARLARLRPGLRTLQPPRDNYDSLKTITGAPTASARRISWADLQRSMCGRDPSAAITSSSSILATSCSQADCQHALSWKRRRSPGIHGPFHHPPRFRHPDPWLWTPMCPVHRLFTSATKPPAASPTIHRLATRCHAHQLLLGWAFPIRLRQLFRNC